MLDLPCNPATSVELPVDNSLHESKFDAPNDCDWFRVTLVGGKNYHFFYKIAAEDGNVISYLSLHDAAGTELTSIGQFAGFTLAGFSYTPASAGTYYLGLKGEKPATYQLGAGPDCADDKPTRCALKTPGKPVTGSLQSYFDYDVFRVRLEAGKTYTFDLLSKQPYEFGPLYLFGRRKTRALGTSVTPPSGYAQARRISHVTAPETGAYFLRFGDATLPDGVFNYELSYHAE
jgi:hypothetical protein